MAVNAIHRLRSTQGVLALRKSVGDVRLEATFTRAITVGDPSTAPLLDRLINASHQILMGGPSTEHENAPVLPRR